jgi:hypothetical protein
VDDGKAPKPTRRLTAEERAQVDVEEEAEEA